MPHVTIMIAGKTYRMACGEGEEPHLTSLAAEFDTRVAEMRKAFGEIGDMRLHVMASLTLADELNEARRRLTALEQETGAIREREQAGRVQLEAQQAQLAGGIGGAAERIERLARKLGGNSMG